MEEKASKLNNLMNCKVNMDFIKNINLPPLKIPKLKPRKVSNSKAAPNRDTIQPPQEPSSFISHSPSRISTIGSLLNDDPEPEPDSNRSRFGRLHVARSTAELTGHCEENLNGSPSNQGDSTTGKALTLQAKFSKQYKELSDFKFKSILNKKTVVKTTSINVNDFKFRADDVVSVRSDCDFEIQSLPDAQLGPDGSFIEHDDYVRPFGVHINVGERQASYESNDSFDESTSLPSLPPPKHQPPPPPPPKRIQSKNVERASSSGDVQPNKSSLFKQVKTMSIKRISEFTERSEKSAKPQPEDNAYGTKEESTPSKKSGLPRMSFNRQTFDDACNKAKTKMSNKIQQLKTLQSRMHNHDGPPKSHDPESRKSEPEVIFPRISYGPEDGGYIRSLPAQDGSRASSRVDMPIGHSRFLSKQDSLESPEHVSESRPERRFTKDRNPTIHISDDTNHSYNRHDKPVQDFPAKPPMRMISQNSWEAHRQEDYQENTFVSRPAPPVPNQKPSGFHGLNFEHPSKMEMIRKRFAQRHDDSLTYNASMHVNMSQDSQDAWVPDVFKGPQRSQINLSAIEEADGAWSGKPSGKKALRKEPSFDIFQPRSEEVFDDFDEALKNTPTVTVAAPKMSNQNVAPVKSKAAPAVKQQALVMKPNEPYLEENNVDRSKHFNKLLTCFQMNSEESTDSISGEFGNHFDMKSVPFMKHDVRIGRRISPISHQGRILDISNKPENVITKAEVTSVMEKSRDNDIVSNTDVAVVRCPSAKRKLCNQETVEEADNEDDCFHSLDYDDGMTYVEETKPVIQQRIVRLVYTAEV